MLIYMRSFVKPPFGLEPENVKEIVPTCGITQIPV
jgi:hypothetical protein